MSFDFSNFVPVPIDLSNPPPSASSSLAGNTSFIGLPQISEPSYPIFTGDNAGGYPTDPNTGLVTGIAMGPANSPTPTGGANPDNFLDNLFRGLGQSIPATTGSQVSNILNRFLSPLLATSGNQPPNSANPQNANTAANPLLGISNTTWLLIGGAVVLIFLLRK